MPTKTLSPFSVGFYWWTWALPSRVVCFPSEASLEKTNFSFASGYQLELAVRDGDMCPLLSCRSVPAPAVSVSLYEGLVLLCLPSPLALPHFLTPLLQGSVIFEKDLMETSHLIHESLLFPSSDFFLILSVVDLLTVFTSDYLLKGNICFRMCLF